MNVHLRQRKQSRQKRISLYLEIYKGTALNPDGKTKILRDYEYLNLYLIEKPATPFDTQSNRETWKLAKSIKAKRELEIKNDQYGFANKKKLNANFIEYFKEQADKRLQSKSNYQNWLSTYSHLKKFAGEIVPFKEVTPQFCDKFKTYLLDTVKKKNEKHLSKASVIVYLQKFKSCLSMALKDKFISDNSAEGLELPKAVHNERAYLTLNELKALVKTECRYDVLKRAFLFSCLTGLRWSDIQKLKWSEVQKSDDGIRIVFHQQKTKGLQYLDISEQARTYLGKQGMPNEKVFQGLKYSAFMNSELLIWVLSATITKHITFHSGRHTFAVLQLTLGTDIYTLSKLLGHSVVKTTEVYAKIIDQTKKDAVNKMPDISL